jgi:hypothetical protein
MNKHFKLVSIVAVFAILGIANAQEAATPATHPAPAPAAHPAPAPAATPAPAPVAAPAPAAPVAAPAPAPAAHPAPAAAAPAATHAPATPAAAHTPAAPAAAPAPAAPVATPAPEAVPVAVESAESPAADTTSVAEAQAPSADSSIAILVVKEDPKKKRRNRVPRNDLSIVDVPANFEIQAKKIMPIDTDNTDHNLDTWWGRANLMVLTESENFIGKIHLRMYPNGYKGEISPNGNDYFQLYEAWAWHRGDYVNVKIGRWDNTTRFGSKTFGGYIDAKKDKNIDNKKNISNRKEDFMSTYDPENAVQFGLNNFSENISLDIALITSDKNLDKGDLRVYFQFKELAGFENMNFGIGYRSNIFDELNSKSRKEDVTHTVDLALRLPLLRDAGILKDLSFFGEVGLIGLDDQEGDASRADNGSIPKSNYPIFPILGGLDLSLYQGLDKIVLELEYDGYRRNKETNSLAHRKCTQGSIYIQRKLNDRFTLNMGTQSENGTKDFSFAMRLQGRIN